MYDFIKIFIIFFVGALHYLLTLWYIPNYKVTTESSELKNDKIGDIKPQFILTLMLSVSIGLSLYYEFHDISFVSVINEDASSEQNIHNVSILETEDKLINDYIIRCYNEIISSEKFSSLTDEQLYYIRNGILAYAGRFYSSGYYEQFEWYKGNILPEDFSWNLLNEFQKMNIEAIKVIEKERGCYY